MADLPVQRVGEYREKGDYHVDLEKTWRYYPVYRAKNDFIDSFMQTIPKSARILDLGCGEGVLVEKYGKQGYDIVGLDYNYSSPRILRGSILNIPFSDSSFDLVLCLDVIEHLHVDEQDEAFGEVRRILKPNGTAVFALPNLAHFLSRITFLLGGRLIRTSSVERHKGDRPIHEYLALIKKNRFTILRRKGIFPTFPITSLLTHYRPGTVMPLHRIMNSLVPYPNWCFLNVVLCRKDGASEGSVSRTTPGSRNRE